MKILVLQGPNLNLVGVKSAQAGKRVTLDKINKILRREVRNTEIELKIFQTHKIYMAISFLHRNRNTASGILIAPMAWAKYEYSLLETLELIQLPIVQVSLDKIVDENQSISNINSHLTLLYKTDIDLIDTLNRETKINIGT